MDANALLTSGQFDRTLARHLTQLLKNGLPCNEDLIRRGYDLTRSELLLRYVNRRDRLVDELESYCVHHDLEAITPFQAAIRRLPASQSNALVFMLLREEPYRITH